MDPSKDAKESSRTTENEEGQLLITNDFASAADDSHIHDIENPHILLLTSLRNKLDRWSPLSNDHSIYKVPRHLLAKNQSAYFPKVVSIGPLHHGRNDLEDMEEYKQRFFAEFLHRTRAQFSLEDYVMFVKEREGKLRDCYADTIWLTSDKLVEIVMVDAAFVVLLLVKFAEYKELEKLAGHKEPAKVAEYKEKAKLKECCRIFGMPCHLLSVTEDMLLLENQLPWFILEDLSNFAKIEIQINKEDDDHDYDDDDFSFIKLACNLINFRVDLGVKRYDLKKIQNHKMAHFLDCLRVCHLSSMEHLQRTGIENFCIPTVTQLHRAGVKFAKSSSTHLLDIEFKDGVLSIPHMFMGNSTETIYRNLLAFDQCRYPDKSRFTDYFAFMDQLVNSPKDIDLLVKRGIIENTLGDSMQAVTVFNGLAQGLAVMRLSYFGHICNQLRAYHKTPWRKWKATLRQDYFNNPWAGISVIAAALLLVFSAIQAVFSIIN